MPITALFALFAFMATDMDIGWFSYARLKRGFAVRSATSAATSRTFGATTGAAGESSAIASVVFNPSPHAQYNLVIGTEAPSLGQQECTRHDDAIVVLSGELAACAGNGVLRSDGPSVFFSGHSKRVAAPTLPCVGTQSCSVELA
jgi:hypothetical protein